MAWQNPLVAQMQMAQMAQMSQMRAKPQQRNMYGGRSSLPTASRVGLSQVFCHTQSPRVLADLLLRYPRLSISEDLTKVTHHWTTLKDSIPLTVTVPFNSHPTFTIPATEEPIHEDSRHIARVMLLTALPQETEEGVPFQHLWRRLKFLVAKRVGSWISALGGTWEAQDGVNPYDDATLIKTAIRHCKSQAGIDLSCCTNWYKFIEYEYHRANGAQDRTVLFLPDLWNHADGDEIKVFRQMKEQEVEVEVEEEEEVEEEVDKEEKVEELSPDGNKLIKTVTKKELKKVMKKVTKTIKHNEKRIVLRSLLVTLGGLLEYVPEDILEETAEVSMFAEAFGEMIARTYGQRILKCLYNKRKADALEAEEIAKRQKYDEETMETPKTRIIVEVTEEVDPDALDAFHYFDVGPKPTGNIRRDALEGIIYSLGELICEREVESLLQSVGLHRPEQIYPPVTPYKSIASNRTIGTREEVIEEEQTIEEEIANNNNDNLTNSYNDDNDNYEAQQ